MRNPFILLGLMGAYLFGRTTLAGFEAGAARDIQESLGGGVVKITSQLGPEAAWGDVFGVTIQASGFEAEGLPLFTEPKRSQSGWLRNLTLDLQNFSLRGLRVESLVAQISDSAFDLGLAAGKKQIRLSRSGEGPGKVVLLAKDLEAFILKKFLEVKRCSVRIDKDKVWIEGSGEFIIFKTDFTVIARIEVEDDTKLVLRHARILLDGKVADEASREALLLALNPVIDLRSDLGLYDAVKVQKIVCREGRIVAEGRVKIPDLPKVEK